MMRSLSTCVFFTVLDCVASFGCAANLETKPMPSMYSPDYGDVVQVIVQVCVPTQEVFFEELTVDLSGTPKAKTFIEQREANGIRGSLNNADVHAVRFEEQGDTDIVRRWIVGSGPRSVPRRHLPFGDVANVDGILSAGSSTIYLAYSTDKNQPVFEAEGRRPQDYIALETSVKVEQNGQHELVKYWFTLSKDIPSDKFSEWQSPISREDKATRGKQKFPTFWNLTHDREMDIHQVDANAPKMRFRLMSIKDYYDDNRFWRRVHKAAAQQYSQGLNQEEREKVKFVPKSKGIVPGC